MRMRDVASFLVIVTISTSLSTTLRAQAPQQFEVTVIRPDLAGPNAGSSLNLFEGGSLKITNEPAKLLIRIAYQLQNSQIVGGPAWLDSTRFDIEAKTGRPDKIQPGQLPPMLQNLLAERINLKFHWEMQNQLVDTLVIESNRSRSGLKKSADGEPSAMDSHGGPGKAQHVVATGTTMGTLAAYVGNRLGRIVVDKSGLADSYDFTLAWAPDEAADPELPSLVTALREQLGLRVERQKSPVQILVIENLQQPSEN
jgi:uncharacterized protein (TIGR03435 family)